MDPQQTIQALASGDPVGVAAVMRAYGERLYDYARGITGTSEEAMDAVHDALLVAVDRIGQLRREQDFNAWLYALTRNEVLRKLGSDSKIEPGVRQTAPLPGGSRENVRALAAAATLSSNERELLDLTVRHGLSKAELAKIFQWGSWKISRQVEQAQQRLEAAWRFLWLAFDDAGSCAGLASALNGWDGTFSNVVRRRIEAHVSDCPQCQKAPKPEVLALVAYQDVLLMPVPGDLERQLLISVNQSAKIHYRGSTAEPFRFDGFPVRLDVTNVGNRQTQFGWAAGLVALLIVMSGAIFWFIQEGGDSQTATDQRSAIDTQGDQQNVSVSIAPSNTSETISVSPSMSPSISVSVSTPALVSRSASKEPSNGAGNTRSTRLETSQSSQPAASQSVPPAKINATLQPQSSGCTNSWRARVTISVQYATAETVTVQWQGEKDSGETVSARSLGDGTYRADLNDIPMGQISWSAVAHTDKGQLRTPTATASRDFCG